MLLSSFPTNKDSVALMLQIDTKIFHEMLGFALPCHTERRITPPNNIHRHISLKLPNRYKIFKREFQENMRADL
jgi:ribosomal protein S17E